VIFIINSTGGRIYYFLGSSVTYGSENNGVSFVDYIAKDYDWECRKIAVSGTTLVEEGEDSYVERLNRIDKSAVMGHMICQLSTNDASQNKILGEVVDSKQLKDFDTATIIGAMEYIICYTYQTWNCRVSFYTNPNYKNDYYESMIDALYQLQKKWDIGIIDIYNYVNIDKLSEDTLNSYMVDSIHPNDKGYRWMADIIGKYLYNSADRGRFIEN
jgi:lysophospholipase L1-like esterase